MKSKVSFSNLAKRIKNIEEDLKTLFSQTCELAVKHGHQLETKDKKKKSKK